MKQRKPEKAESRVAGKWRDRSCQKGCATLIPPSQDWFFLNIYFYF